MCTAFEFGPWPAAVSRTGPPAGVGPFSAGDVVEVAIDGLGVLRNTGRASEPRS